MSRFNIDGEEGKIVKPKGQDELLGGLTWKYIDRMDDPSPYDPAEKILKEFCEEWHKVVFGDK